MSPQDDNQKLLERLLKEIKDLRNVQHEGRLTSLENRVHDLERRQDECAARKFFRMSTLVTLAFLILALLNILNGCPYYGNRLYKQQQNRDIYIPEHVEQGRQWNTPRNEKSAR